MTTQCPRCGGKGSIEVTPEHPGTKGALDTEAQLARETTSSVEVQRAKDGSYYWSAKIYFNGDDETEREVIAIKLAAIDRHLRELFLGET